MGNKTSAFLAVTIIAIFVADLTYFGWDLHLIIGKRMLQLIEYMAFWR